MTIKRILAIIMALALSMLLLTACGKDKPVDADPVTTTADQTEETTDVPDTTGEDDTTEDETTTEAESSSEGETTAEGVSTSEGETTTEAETTTKAAAAPALPQGKAEILAAYTKVVDKVKIDMPEYKSNDWQTMSNVDMNGVLYAAVSGLAKQFLETKEESSPGTQTAGNHAKWFAMPTDTLKKGCVLTDTSKIESASCVKSGDNYVITITLIEEKDPIRDMANPSSVSSWHGKLFDVIDIVEVFEVAKSIPGVNANNAYSKFKGTATLTYNPVTNECIKLDHIIDVRCFIGSSSAKVIADYHFYDFKW